MITTQHQAEDEGLHGPRTSTTNIPESILNVDGGTSEDIPYFFIDSQP